MKNRAIWIVLGVLAFFFVLGVGAVTGGALAYLALRSSGLRPVLAAAPLRLPVEQQERQAGVLVSAVTEDSPAERAGIVRGDILLEVNGEAVDTPAQVFQVSKDLQAGDSVDLTVLHGDERRTLQATLGDQDSRSLGLGIEVCGVSFERNLRMGLRGAVLTEVVEGSPAAEAGLQVGDRITALDGQEIGLQADLAELIRTHQPGDVITLSVERDGEESQEFQVTLGESPEEEGKAYLGVRYTKGMPALPGIGPDGKPFEGLPFEGQPFEHNFPALPEGVEAAVIAGQVIEGSPAEAAGLQAGDVIVSVDGEAVESPEVFVQLVQARQPGDKVLLEVVRSGEAEPIQLEVTLGEHPEQAGKAYLGVQAQGFIQMHRDHATPEESLPWQPFLQPEEEGTL